MSLEISKEQVEQLARTEHNRWNMEKLLLGYRPLTHSERQLSSAEQKQLKNKLYAHPLIAPYEQLNETDKELDKNIISMLPEILRMLDQ